MWTLMKEGGDAENFGAAHKEFMIDSISDIDNEPTQYGSIAPGSFAYTAGYETIFQKNANGEWVEASDGGEGPSTIAWDNITGKPTVFPPDGNNLVANGAVKISATTTGTQPSLSVAQGGPDVTGAASASIGNGNTVSGTCSLAVGGGCQATGGYSIAAGSGVRATAVGSAAFGGGSEANALCSLAAGYSSIANSEYQIVVGKYNVKDDDDEYAVIVGNGSNGSRSNALTVDWNGDVESAGNLTIHYDGEEIDVGEAITSGGGGGESKVEFDLTQEQIMSYVSSSKFTLTSEQLADIDVSNPPAKLIFNGELGSNKMTVCLSLLSSESFGGFGDSLSYGLIGGQGEAYHDVRSFTCQISISDGAATSGWVDFNLIMKSPDTEGTNGQVLTTDGQGGVSWTTPSGGGLTELNLEITSEQVMAWRSGGKFAFTEQQLAYISFDNPVDKITIHGEIMDSMFMNISMYLQNKQSLMSGYLSYGSTGGQGDIIDGEPFGVCTIAYCSIKFDDSGSAVEGWFAQSCLPQALIVPSSDGTYILKCTVNNGIPSCSWEAES